MAKNSAVATEGKDFVFHNEIVTTVVNPLLKNK